MKIRRIIIQYLNSQKNEKITSYISKNKDIKKFIADLFLQINKQKIIKLWLSNTSVVISKNKKFKSIKLKSLALENEHNCILDKILKSLRFKQLIAIKNMIDYYLNCKKTEANNEFYQIVVYLNRLVISVLENKKERKSFWTLVGSLIAAGTSAATIIFTIISKAIWKI